MSIYTQTFLGTTTCGTNSCTTPLKLSYNSTYVVVVGVSSVGSLSFTLPSSATTTFLCPLISESTTSSQMTLRYNSTYTSTFDTSSAGNMTVQASGTYIDFNSANKVRVLNTTNSSSTITGCLILTGGLGVNGDVYAAKVLLESTSPPQFMIKYGNGSIYNSFGTDSSGNLTILSTGTYTIHKANLYVDAATATYRVYGRLYTSYTAFLFGPWGGTITTTVSLEKWGYMVFMTTTAASYVYNNVNPIYFYDSASYIPADYRPDHDMWMPTTVQTAITPTYVSSAFRVLTTGQCYWYATANGGSFSAGRPGILRQTLCWLSNTSL